MDRGVLRGERRERDGRRSHNPAALADGCVSARLPALVTYAMDNRAVMSLGGGAAVGAIVGFLMWWPGHGATGGVAVAAVVKSMSSSVQRTAQEVARV